MDDSECSVNPTQDSLINRPDSSSIESHTRPSPPVLSSNHSSATRNTRLPNSSETSSINATSGINGENLRNLHSLWRWYATKTTWRSFLHAVGLKILSSKRVFQSSKKQERRKPVFVKSRRIALTKAAVHLLLSTVTVSLIVLNVVTWVNGPDISTSARYLLQGASKLHELTILGSLAAVVGDALRYQLTRDGVNFGLLGSAFSFTGLNFLWSQEFCSAIYSAIRNPSPPRSKIPFLLLLFICCCLAAIVGPASALLFLPSKAWLSTGSTEFYLAGNESQLWPQHLTLIDSDPQDCKNEFGETYYCLHAAWSAMRGYVTPQGASRRLVSLNDASTPRTMWIWRPYDENCGTDSWSSTPHSATAYLGLSMDGSHDRAFKFAKGRGRRLRDVTEGYYTRIKGRVPLVRVVCAPFKHVSPTEPAVYFPVLNENEDWRYNSRPGKFKELNISAPTLTRVNITWVSLPPVFGTTTGGLAYISSNANTTVGSGCSIDARWAQGEINAHGNIGERVWQAIIGDPGLPNGIRFRNPPQVRFFKPGMKEYLGHTLTADLNFLQALSKPAHQAYNSLNGTDGASTPYTTLEMLLLNTRLWDVPWVIEYPVDPIMELEAMISAYFVSAISRIGWAPQHDYKSTGINPLLRIGGHDNQNLLYDGGQIWKRPTNISTCALKQEWFSYTTAWQLNDDILYLSITVLSIHLFIAITHSIIIIYSGHTSESWDSITELIALAYKTLPSSHTLENCGAGIMLLRTLRQNVKVVAVDEGEGEDRDRNDRAQRVQLISCDEQETDNALLTSRVDRVRVGKEYG